MYIGWWHNIKHLEQYEKEALVARDNRNPITKIINISYTDFKEFLFVT